jgi:predicted O-linked N-acetylglucosamine transferase (SPINDLY family)
MTVSDTAPSSVVLPARFADALSHFNGRDYDAALIVCEQILSVDPDRPEAIMLLGLISFDLDEPLQAIDLLTRAHELSPQIADYANALASIQARIGNTAEALFLAKLATTLQPYPGGATLLPTRHANFFENIKSSNPDKFRRRAEKLLEAGDLSGAEAAVEMQLRLTPGDPETLRLTARILGRGGNVTRAISALHAVIHTEPRIADRLALSMLLGDAGRHAEAAMVDALAARQAPDDVAVSQHRLRNIARDPNRPAAEIAAAKRGWCDRWAARRPVPAPAWTPAESADGMPSTLSVGFTGAGLDDPCRIHLLAPVFAGLKRRGVRLFVYSDDRAETASTDLLSRHVKRWTGLHGVDPETAAAIIRGDRIDVAVDLTGHARQSRLGTFAWRPAPVCVSWCGAALPTAGPFDHFLTGPQMRKYAADAPAGVHAWPLPKTPLVYPSPPGRTEPTPLPMLDSGQPTFGTAMHLAAIGEQTLELWAGLLAAIPRSRLLVANIGRLDNDCTSRAYDLVSHVGLRHRIDIVDLDDDPRLELGFWNHVDIAIDPQPIGSFIRTCQAMWMGVPVIAIDGARFGGRKAAMAVTAAGHAAWVAADIGGAVALARSLVADANFLAEQRRKLPAEIAGSSLANGDALADAIAVAFVAMLRQRAAAR